MNSTDTRSVLTIALMAAFADGLKDERERAAVKRVAEALGPEAGFDLPGLYREVLLAKPAGTGRGGPAVARGAAAGVRNGGRRV